MTITQLIQSSPANVNELFTKLAGTSKGAVKTRDSLFSDLKAELELHSRLEEEHLFPVLRKHQQTKDLVRSAVDGNKQARALMAELDGMPKEGDEFLAKLSELRKTFQQHVRDEKKELLPAVKAALSDEEAQTITQKVEADIAEIDEGKRQEALARRAAAQQKREEAEARRVKAEARKQRALDEQKRQQAEIRAEQRRAREEKKRVQEAAEADQRRASEAGKALAQTADSAIRAGQLVVAAGGTAAQASTEATLRGSQQFMGVVTDAVDKAGATIVDQAQTSLNRILPGMEGLRSFTRYPPVAAAAAMATGKTWFELISRGAENRSQRSLEMMRCLTPQDAAQVQTRYVGSALRAWLDANSRMLDISLEACRGVTQQVERSTGRTKEARRSV